MKTLLRKITNSLKTSLLQTREYEELEGRLYLRKSFPEKIEESFLAIAYAEAADLKDFLNVLKSEKDFVHPDECQYGDNEMCCLES